MSDRSDSRSGLGIRLIGLVLNIIKIYIQVILETLKGKKRKDVSGQNVLITGSGHGLGREMALEFAKLGANLALVDINEKNNEAVKNEALILNESIKVYSYSIDIRNEKQVGELSKLVKSDLGGVDILINNAGIVQCLPFLDLSPDLVERTFQVNVLAHIWTIRHFLPDMIKRKRGHIVAISSIAGLIGNKYLTDYCASKFAVVGLMESLDIELHHKGANDNLHLTTICPASMSTGMFQTFTSRFSWFLPVLKADQVATIIIDGVLRNRTLVVIPKLTHILLRLSFLVPDKVRVAVQDFLDYGVKPHRA